MTNQQIAYIVQAVADGCKWRIDAFAEGRYGFIPVLFEELLEGEPITLVPESWDWPQERRIGRKCWTRYYGEHPDWHAMQWSDWMVGIVDYSDIEEERLGHEHWEFVAINPAAPDQPPPSDWSPETYPRVLEDEENE